MAGRGWRRLLSRWGLHRCAGGSGQAVLAGLPLMAEAGPIRGLLINQMFNGYCRLLL
ncbi:hypothetical protein [Eubacterium aggregans]|uniref:hypothetical protein n=1 Tax=Eubacterium aggregans TaxID=81409 RepID=UPI0015A18CF8|nr:hypothetical protein [Eubacterium aggregans]